jgi:hypothetical protein
MRKRAGPREVPSRIHPAAPSGYSQLARGDQPDSFPSRLLRHTQPSAIFSEPPGAPHQAPMELSRAQRLEQMIATLVRAMPPLENHDVREAKRLLSLLQGMIEGAFAQAQRGKWRR